MYFPSFTNLIFNKKRQLYDYKIIIKITKDELRQFKKYRMGYLFPGIQFERVHKATEFQE